jgi:hypothetical protein
LLLLLLLLPLLWDRLVGCQQVRYPSQVPLRLLLLIWAVRHGLCCSCCCCCHDYLQHPAAAAAAELVV